MAGFSQDHEKRRAAVASAELVEVGMRLGLGTGSTVAFLLPALAERALDVVCVSSSPRTEAAARTLGLRVESFDQLNSLDLAIDGADQVAPDGWLIKGGGGAHTREKIVAHAASTFVVIVDSSKLVERLQAPVPLELLTFGLHATMHAIGDVELRAGDVTPDHGVLADFHGAFDDPALLAEHLSDTPGVVEHGLFEPALVTKVLVGRGDSVEHLTPRGTA